MPVIEHRLVDPVAIEDVPEDSAEITGERCTAQITRVRDRPFVEQPIQQRDEGDPGQEGSPARHRSGDRKAKIEQDGRDNAEKNQNHK